MDADSPMTDSSDSPGASALLSPPESQRDRAARGAISPANANGKRPRKDISNGFDTEDENPTARQQRSTNAAGVAATSNVSGLLPEAHEHAASGYKWNKLEDEPGYAWMNKKAVDEHNRALDSLIHKDAVIGGRYGDPFELAAKESEQGA